MDSGQLEYQDRISNEASNILQRHGLVYLAMEMRTGKTITAFMTCKKLFFKKVLMVSKKKALSSLKSDYEKLFSDDFEFYCTNFEQIHNIEFDPDVVIIDEAHSLGQFPKPAVRTKSLKEVCEGLPIIYLSGTPTPESYSQLFHQFWVSSFSPFKNYKNFYRWCDDYVQVTTRFLGQIRVQDYSHAYEQKVKESTNHLFLSLTTEQAGFKQEIMEKVITIKMNPTTLNLIKALKADRVVYGKDGSIVLAETAAKLMSKIHQISSGTVILEEPKKEVKVFDYSKAHYIRDNYKDKKIAIYYKFVGEWGAILATFGGKNITDDPEVFRSTGPEVIFCSQFQSGREGVNLDNADYIIMYNIDYSAVSYFQTRSRMQSKNRKKKSEVHWIFSDIGIESKIYNVVSQKKDYTLSYFKKDYPDENGQYSQKVGPKLTIYANSKEELDYKVSMFDGLEEFLR